MPTLRSKWRRQPPQGTQIDKYGVLARAGRLAFVASAGVIPVAYCKQSFSFPAVEGAGSYRQFDQSATGFAALAWKVSSLGVGHDLFPGGTNKQFRYARPTADAYIEIPTGSDWTHHVLIDAPSYTGTNPRVFDQTPTSTFIVFPSTGLWVRVGGTDFVSATARPAAGKAISVVTQFVSGSGIKAWVNGVQVLNSATAQTTPDTTGTNGINTWGGNGGGAEYLNGNWLANYLWHSAVPAHICAWLSADPLNTWAMYAPKQRRVYVNSVAAGAFKPFWAVQNNSVVGAGVH